VKLAVRIPQGRSIGPIQQSYAARFELSARLIDVVDANRELKSRSGVGRRDLRRRDEARRLRADQQIIVRLSKFTTAE